MPVNGDWPVVSVGEWQSEQPMEENKDAPFKVDEVDRAGVGGANKRANSREGERIRRHLRRGARSTAAFVHGVVLFFGRAVESAASRGASFGGKQFIRDTHLDLVSLSRENQQRFVLPFPAKTRDAAEERT